MNNIERNISLIGKTGREYYGKMYESKNTESSLSGQVIVCLSNTSWEDNHWVHQMRDIYRDDALAAIHHFNERNDITHMILIPETNETGVDIINDLRKQYIHK